MDKLRLALRIGEQTNYLKNVVSKSNLSIEGLAKIVGVHHRTFIDWIKEKNHLPLFAARILNHKFSVVLPENEDILIARWKELKREASRKGGKALIKKYGSFATAEGRKKGGQVSWQRRKNNKEILPKYSHIITRPEESVDLAELVGILLGDGGLTHFQCVIYLNSETDVAFSKYIQNLCKKLFGIIPAIYKSKKVKLLRVSISSVNLIEYLLEKGLILGNKVKLQVAVPRWVYKNKEYIKACIRGLIDTDGCFIINKYKVKKREYKYPKMIFCNSSIPLLNFVIDGLKACGFTPKNHGNKYIWLSNQAEVRRYLREIGTRNYKPTVKLILESGPDGKAQVR